MKVIAKILTWLLYLLMIMIVIAAIALVADFTLWIFDLEIKLP